MSEPEVFIPAIESEIEGPNYSDGNTGNHRNPSRISEKLWELGWTDGRLGADRKPIEDLLDAVRDGLEACNKHEVSNLQRSEEKRKRSTNVEIWERATKAWDNKFSAEPMHFSRPAAWWYLVAGFVLLISDIAINYTLLTDAFQLKQYPFLRVLLCIGVVALSGVCKLFFDEWVFSEREQHWKTRAGTLVLLLMMIIALVLTTEVRTQYQASLADVSVSPALEVAMKWAYLALNVAFALAGGYLLAFALSILGNSGAREAARKELDLMNTRLAEFDSPIPDSKKITPEAAAKRLRAIYDHGFNRGAMVRWTLWQGKSVYDQSILALRRRVASGITDGEHHG